MVFVVTENKYTYCTLITLQNKHPLDKSKTLKQGKTCYCLIRNPPRGSRNTVFSIKFCLKENKPCYTGDYFHQLNIFCLKNKQTNLDENLILPPASYTSEINMIVFK